MLFMPIQSVLAGAPTTSVMKPEANLKPTSYEAQQSFSEFFKDALNNVNKSQVESDVLTQKLVLGENVDLHEVMVAAQKASITLNATMEMRNKVVEAYQEIIRMPV